MNLIIISFSILISFLHLLSITFASELIVLTPDNFDSIVNGEKHVLIKFYAPWCGHCKNLAPVYEDLATAFSKQKEKVIIAEVDCDAHSALGTKYGIQGYPTIKYFAKGGNVKEPEDYSGGRDLPSMITFMNEKAGTNVKPSAGPPSDVTVITTTNFKQIVLDPKKAVLVEFYAPWCGHCKNLAPVYEKVATTFVNDDIVIVSKVDGTEEKDLSTKFEIKGFPTLLFFPADESKLKDDFKPETYSSGRDEASFVQYLNQYSEFKWEAGGKLAPSAARIQEVEVTVSGQVITDDLVKKVKGLSFTAEDGKYHAIYVKTIEKIIAKTKNAKNDDERKTITNDYLQKQIDRLTNMVEGGQIKPDKKKEFMIRINVLKGIKGEPLEGKEEEEAVEPEVEQEENEKEEL